MKTFADRSQRRPPVGLPLAFGALLLLASAAGSAPEGEASGEAPQTQPQTQAQTQSKPQIVRLAAPAGSMHHLFLYLFDGLGARDIPAFGYDRATVPNLSKMMEEGMTFTGVYSVSPWTVPSVTSILTSLYPSAHGVQRAGDRLPASARTLAEVMKENGYATALFSAHPLIGALSGLDQGFDWIEEIPGPFGPAPPSGPGETSATLNRRILAWLDQRTSSAPTFIVALSGDPLEPFGAPEPEGRRYLEKGEYEWYSGVRRKLLQARPGNLGLATPGDLRRLKVDPDRFARAAHGVRDGAILHNDRQLGSLKEELQPRGYWKNALFVATSTHGEDLGERGLFGHGASLYDQALRIPLVMSFPPLVAAPRQMRKTCDSVDLLPTLLSMMGLPIPEGVQGIERNVEPTLEVSRLYTRAAYAEMLPAGALPTGRASMIAEQGAKLIVYGEPPQGLEGPEMEFFRGNDPAGWEKRNLVASAPNQAAKKREILEGWRQVKGKLQLVPDDKAVPPDPRLKEILRSLGYLQGMEPAKSKKP